MKKLTLLIGIMCLWFATFTSAGTTISQGGTCGYCLGNQCEDPILPRVGSCNCRVNRFGVCLESGSGCLTGWFCEDTGEIPPNSVAPNDESVNLSSLNTPEIFPRIFLDLEGKDGYAIKDDTAVLRITNKDIVYVSINNRGIVTNYVTLKGRVGYEELSASRNCSLPSLDSFSHRLYMYCQFGIDPMPKRDKVRMPKFQK